MVYVMHVAASQAIATSLTLADRDRSERHAAGKHLTTLAFSEADRDRSSGARFKIGRAEWSLSTSASNHG